MKVGYMVPEFPGQTHTFFWREILHLRKLGIEVDLVSTREPKSEIFAKHDWAAAAKQITTYLSPLSINFFAIALYAARRLDGLWHCAKVILSASDARTKEKLKLFLVIVYSLKLARLAEDRGWEHIHSHFCYTASDIVLFSSIISGVGYSISKHGPDFGYGNQTNKWNMASFGTVITRRMKSELLAERGSALEERVFIISMGVDSEFFKRSTPYVYPSLNAPVRIFCCARINPSKGQSDLIELASVLRSRGIRSEIRIAGAAAGGQFYLESLKQLAQTLGVQDCITFLGGLSEMEIKRELEKTQIFILPSRDEPLGVAYMEAMSMEVPTIGYAAGGVPELISNKENGFLCKLEDVGCLADTVEHIMKKPDRVEAIRVQARKTIVANYDSSIGAKKMANLFQIKSIGLA